MIRAKKNGKTLLELDNTSSNEEIYIKLGDGSTDPIFYFPKQGGVLLTENGLTFCNSSDDIAYIMGDND